MKYLQIYCTTNKNIEINDTYLYKYQDIVIPINTDKTNYILPNIFYLNYFLCEFTTFYYVWYNKIMSKYIGFCHYRRLLPIDFIKENLSDNFNGYLIFDRTSWYDGVFFPLIRNSYIYMMILKTI